MIAAGVPVIPGMEEADQRMHRRQKHCADQIGYPVMIKASAGGGGKGMREAASKEVFAELFAVAQTGGNTVLRGWKDVCGEVL